MLRSIGLMAILLAIATPAAAQGGSTAGDAGRPPPPVVIGVPVGGSGAPSGGSVGGPGGPDGAVPGVPAAAGDPEASLNETAVGAAAGTLAGRRIGVAGELTDPAEASTIETPATGFGGSPIGTSLGSPGYAARAEMDASTGSYREAGRGAGLSGAIRVLLASGDATLDPAALRQFGSGWESGHRWIPIEGAAGPAVLGEPVPIAPDFRDQAVVAPETPGSWLLESGGGASVTVFTQLPASAQSGGRLNGYHIGTYPTAGSNREDIYAPPEAFIEVTPGNRDLPVSRHLRLGQFLTKDQFEVWPKYVALDLRLIDKLELVVAELNAMGFRAERLHVMSGFRTPQYNGPGGDGRASLSRHMWGDAADVWVDNDLDGQMDDLNGDGLIDMDDAAVMMRAVERVENRYPELTGGAGTYPTTSTHGPYIHIDARGQRARW